jgi:hypothetical protein
LFHPNYFRRTDLLYFVTVTIVGRANSSDQRSERIPEKLHTSLYLWQPDTMSIAGGSTRKELLTLYRRLLRSAETYPSKKRESIYQAIREEWRENATLTEEDKIRREISVAYKGLSQLRQFDEMTMTGGATGSPNWKVTLEQNPMPKPVDYSDKKKEAKK